MDLDEDWSDGERIATLRTYGIGRDADYASLQEIVELAARLCGTPMAFVSVVEGDRQWFPARTGFDLKETPIENAICAQVMRLEDIVVIEDTWADDRTATNPLCTPADGLRFYAAVPLRAPNGHALGMLAVLDHMPRDLACDRREILTVLGRQIMTQLELRRALHRADILRREVDHRVKNSLQSVASLTRIQAQRAALPEVREALQVVSRRIITVAELNAHLYRTGEQRIALQPFLGSVIGLIAENAPESVGVEFDIADINVTTRTASSLAMIVNEFATNSFKHAFPNGREGRIRIVGARLGLSRYRIECSDDGIGMPQNAQEGLGLSIISSAVDALPGDLRHHQEGEGHRILVTFRP